jgi:heme exporter protein A
MILICDNLTAHYNAPLFSGLGFSVGQGSLLVLKGHNGSGKTTLLKMLAGLKQPQEGCITLDGTEAHQLRNEQSRQLCYLGHQLAVKPQLTVRQNLEFWARLRDTEMLLPAAVMYFQLQPLLNTPCYALSAGWKKRLALARVMASDAGLWLLDEPETNLDEEGRALLHNLIMLRADQGGAVIIATHNPGGYAGSAVLELADFAKIPR